MKTTDIVIPLNADGSGNNNDEIRYCLRSIERNLIGYRYIIVVCSNPPRWLKNVAVVNVSETNRKAITLFNKRIEAAKISDADNIILWSDDQVLLKKVNALDIPTLRVGFTPMSKCLLETNWHKILRNTARVLDDNGKSCWNCESHSPCVFDRKKFISLENLFEREINEEPGIVTGSLYHNYFESIMHDINLFKTTFDSKLCKNSMTKEKIGARMFLGYNNIGFENGVKEFLLESFKYKSKNEV